jgi:alpha-N-arabinofuranosidase
MADFSIWHLAAIDSECKGAHIESADQCSNGPTYPAWIQHLARPAYVDVVAILVTNDDGSSSVRLSVLNRHPEIDWDGQFDLNGFGKCDATHVTLLTDQALKKVEVHAMYHDDMSAAVRRSTPVAVRC